MSWAPVAGVAAALWIVEAIACTPILAASRGRALFETWPSRSVAANYVIVSLGMAVGHVLAFLGVVGVLGGLEGGAVLWAAVATNFGFPLLVAAVAAVGHSRAGRRGPAGDRNDVRPVLVLGALWYGAVATGAIVLLLFVLTFWFYPG